MLSIIIVNYLQKELLSKCVDSIYRVLQNGNFEIIIINNSPGELLDEISAVHPSVNIIQNENTGFSKANNLGAEHSIGEFLLFLNADTELLNDFTDRIINELSGKNYGAVGPKLQFDDGGFQNSFGLFPSIINEYKNRNVELAFRNKDTKIIDVREKEYSVIKEVDWVTGAAMLIKKDVFLKVNGFDERFFLYYEDIDLCFRLKKAGYKNYYYPPAKVIHHKGENIRSSFKRESKRIQDISQRLYYKVHKGFFQNLMLKIIKAVL